jgi:hypothetical protein
MESKKGWEKKCPRYEVPQNYACIEYCYIENCGRKIQFMTWIGVLMPWTLFPKMFLLFRLLDFYVKTQLNGAFWKSTTLNLTTWKAVFRWKRKTLSANNLCWTCDANQLRNFFTSALENSGQYILWTLFSAFLKTNGIITTYFRRFCQFWAIT